MVLYRCFDNKCLNHGGIGRKKDFTDIYTQKSPNAYLKEMQRLDYFIPDKTKPLYLSLAKQPYKKLSRIIKILDITGARDVEQNENVIFSLLGYSSRGMIKESMHLLVCQKKSLFCSKLSFNINNNAKIRKY